LYTFADKREDGNLKRLQNVGELQKTHPFDTTARSGKDAKAHAAPVQKKPGRSALFPLSRPLPSLHSLFISPRTGNERASARRREVGGMGSRRRGNGRRKVGRKKRRMRSRIRHRK